MLGVCLWFKNFSTSSVKSELDKSYNDLYPHGSDGD